VNEYLQEISGESFTAKDFRTWHATSEALESLAGQPFVTAREAKQKMKEVLQTVATRLGNTPAMCRKCYINPVVIDAFLAGELRENALKGGGNERVRLLQILTHTPAGHGFGNASRQRPRKHVKTSHASSRSRGNTRRGTHVR
jgi:DNA topoisomerase-1